MMPLLRVLPKICFNQGSQTGNLWEVAVQGKKVKMICHMWWHKMAYRVAQKNF